MAATLIGSVGLLSACSEAPQNESEPANAPGQARPAPESLLEDHEIVVTAAFDEGDGVNDLVFLPNEETPWLGRLISANAEGGLDLYNIQGNRLGQMSGPSFANLAGVARFDLRGTTFPMVLGNDREGGLHAYVVLAEDNQLIEAPISPVTLSGGVVGVCHLVSGIGYVDIAVLGGEDQAQLVRFSDTGEDLITASVRAEFSLPYPARHCQGLNDHLYISGPTSGVSKLTLEGEVVAESEALSVADIVAVELQGRPIVIASVADTPMMSVYDANTLEEISTLSSVDGLNTPMITQAGALAISMESFGGSAFVTGMMAVHDEGDDRIKLVGREVLSRAIIGSQLDG